jgi:hypothetical protein
LNAASARLAKAKGMFTAAAQATLRGDADAAHRAQAALAERDAERADQEQLQDLPPPVGVWAESLRLRAGL